MTNEITLGVALIVGKDRKEEVELLLPQLAAFDQIVVVNTSGQGSINTYVKKLAKKYGGRYEVHDYVWRPTPFKSDDEMYDLNDWGFSGARNASFKYLKTTHAVWLDTDDLIGVKYNGKDIPLPPKAAADAFRKIAAEAPDVDVWFADYVYSRDEYGNPNVVHARERMVRLECGWRWVYPIHECLIPARRPKHAGIRDIEILHYPRNTEPSAERNLRMLTAWLNQLEKHKGYHMDLGRCRLQIGETYWGLERYREAADWLENVYLAQHDDAIDLEKWQGACFASRSYIHCGNLQGAERMALKALSLEPGLQDGYLLLAEIKLLGEQDPQDVLELMDVGGRKDDPPPEVLKNPLDYTFVPFCISSQAKYNLGQYESALEFALRALAICPNDPRPEKLRAQAAAKLRAQEGAQAALALYQLLRDYDEHEKAAQIFDMLPYAVQRNDEIHKVADGAAKRADHIYHPDKYVEFYSEPPGWEPIPWNFFEEGKIPGYDRYNYIRTRLKKYPHIKKVLVVGCEDGFHALLLAKEGYQVVGIDLNKEAIRIANERAEKLGVPAKFLEGWIEKIRLDTMQDPFDPESNWEEQFDAVIASEQLERARDVSFFMGTLGDCLAPNGIILLTTPDGSWDDGDHPHSHTENVLPKTVRTFQQDTLEALLRSGGDGFHVTECHFLPYSNAYREEQGWQVAEIVKRPPPSGPRIRIFCGELVEPFSPASLETGGIGGSETAVIHMADWWAKMGCRVAVYTSNVGVFDGVLYRYADEFSHELESDIFISWRLPSVFGLPRPNAKVTVLWCHDIYYPQDVRPEWIEKIDIIAVLSEAHKETIMSVHPFPEEKVWVTRNGIDPLRYTQKVEKKKFHYFFSSSHERGLEEIIQIWPEIKKEIPEAVLHVGYGTYTAGEMMKSRRDFEGLDQLRAFEQTLYESDGIIYHGRMNQWELARVQLECEAWLYPYQHAEKWGGLGGFVETYCITAVEAQAAGAIPITRLNGALPEVVKYCIEWKKDWTTQDVITTLKNLKYLVDPDKMQVAQEWALGQTWRSLAEQWLKHFISLRKEEEIS